MNPIRDFFVALGAVKPRLASPLELAVEQYEQAQRDSLKAEARAEEYAAEAEMLHARVSRLRFAVQNLAREAGDA